MLMLNISPDQYANVPIAKANTAIRQLLQAGHVLPLALPYRHARCLGNSNSRLQQLHVEQSRACRPSGLCISISTRSTHWQQSRRVAAGAAAPAEAASNAAQQDASCLQNLLLWLVNNGEQHQQQQHSTALRRQNSAQ
jgi:hypothetical protein